MKLAVITDTHVGARSGSSIFREYFRWWYDEHFFKPLAAQKVSTILHCGDFFDNRNAVTLQDIDFVCKWFAGKLVEHDMRFYITLGNHDVAYKNTNKVHSLAMLAAAAPRNVVVIEEMTAINFGTKPFVLVPWLNSENSEHALQYLQTVSNPHDIVVAGHFEIAGAKHYAKSAPAEHGLSPDVFSKFKRVWSGHFHHKSTIGNVLYLGSAFHLNWQDHNDDRGYHIYDTELDTMTFVENDHSLFVEIMYNREILKPMTDAQALELFEGRFIRLIVDCDYSQAELLEAIGKINRAKPHDLQVINNMLVGTTADDSDKEPVDVTQSTIDFINSYIANDPAFNTAEVKAKMNSLYTVAMNTMTKGE